MSGSRGKQRARKARAKRVRKFAAHLPILVRGFEDAGKNMQLAADATRVVAKHFGARLRELIDSGVAIDEMVRRWRVRRLTGWRWEPQW